jgi:hypothetical protein
MTEANPYVHVPRWLHLLYLLFIAIGCAIIGLAVSLGVL